MGATVTMTETGSGHWGSGTATAATLRRAPSSTEKIGILLEEEIRSEPSFEGIIGASPALEALLQQVQCVAPTDATVLIEGETGAGKELIARAVHNISPRFGFPFIKMNCAAIPFDLLESELFGHERGAFTGAVAQRTGRFELADKGTLFLDEVGDMPLGLQPKLLRVLQEQEFERLGSTCTYRVDVRLIAATNQDLLSMVERNQFREDLYYRLNVFPVHVPPLRERIDDIPLLVEYLIDRYAQKAGKEIRQISKQTLDLLKAYDWPGNIRELQNVVERAVILCDGETFRVDETWFMPVGPKPASSSAPSIVTLAERERAAIESVLRETRGVISGPAGAAVKLGIPRQTLEYKIHKFGINRFQFKTA
jgi:transcriptional regulator with GAF, ATPase, and Fis domain